MGNWTSESHQIPKFPSLSFPQGATLQGPLASGLPHAKLPALRRAEGRVQMRTLGVLYPEPQTSPERGSHGTHRPGLQRRRSSGSAVPAPLVPALAGAEAGSGGAPARLWRWAGLHGVRPSCPLPTRENLSLTARLNPAPAVAGAGCADPWSYANG